MKHFVILLALLVGLSGCVSLKKHDELKKEASELRQKSEAVIAENRQLKQKNALLTQEIQQSRQSAEYLYKSGVAYFEKNQYDRAMENFEKLIDRYPADSLVASTQAKIAELSAISAAHAKAVLKTAESTRDTRSKVDILDRGMEEQFLTKEDRERLLKRRQSYYGEVKLLEETNKYILVEDDPTLSQKIYRTTRSTQQKVGYDKNFSIEIYLVQHYSGKRDFRLRTRYVGDKWISYDAVTLRGDNGTHADIVCKYPDKLSNMVSDRVYEWSDNDIDDDKVIKLSKTHSITVRLSGGYKYSFELSDEHMQAIREIVRKYQSLR